MELQTRSWKRYRTDGGSEYAIWERPVPRIPDHIADCSIYLYPSVQSAREGSNFGGSGFLVHVPSEVAGFGHLYAVTNWHVIEGGCGVVRLSTKGGGTETIQTQFDDWKHPESGEDVAVLPFQIGAEANFKWFSIGANYFLDRSVIEAYNIGYGDEVFMVGRLVTHSGKQRNAVVVRFGNISLMADPGEPIQCRNGPQEGFLVECRSLSGFSGSPVFVTTSQDYRGEQWIRVERYHREKNPPRPGDPSPSRGDTFGPWLLGIDWGHIPIHKKIEHKQQHKWIELDEYRVEINSGIACVLPAWKILTLLNHPELLMERETEDRRIAQRLQRDSESVNDIEKTPLY